MSLWRNPNFLKLWVGQTISEIGSRVSREGIPWTAVALLNATPFHMGLLTTMGGVTSLIAGPLAGAVADRHPRKPIMIAADLLRAAVLATVPIAAWQGWLSMPLLFVVVILAGLGTLFFDVAYQSIVPSMVQGEELLQANARLSLTLSIAEVIGPAMTGMLVQLLTAPRAIAIDSASFVLSALAIGWIRLPEQKRAIPAHEASAWSEMREGLRYVRDHAALRLLAARMGTAAFFYGFFGTLYIVFAVRELHIGPAALGVVIALGGISSMCGALVAERAARRFPVAHVLMGATVLSGLSLLLIPLATGPTSGVILLGLGQLIGDISYPVYNINELTLRQKLSGPRLLGRVNACMQMLFKGLLPMGALVCGIIATAYGMRVALAISSAGVCLSALWLLPLQSHLQQTSPPPPSTPA
ncbi:MAG: MFS transporter [Bryobacterales bacterium]|nr:MFS transporter [Bryobacterales bacterium]